MNKTCCTPSQHTDGILRYTLCETQTAGVNPKAEAFTTTRLIGRDPIKLCDAFGIQTVRFARPHQVHGVVIRQIAEEFFALPDNIRTMLLDGVDAVIYDVKNACIGISTADCIPVVCYDTKHHCAAAIHAGWRGTADRIVIRAIEQMHTTYGTEASDMHCVIGPGISMQSFEVGDEVYDSFAEKGFPMADIAIQMPDTNSSKSDCAEGKKPLKWHINLKECNRMLLLSLGVREENIIVSDIDTMTDLDFFSARREGAETGRMLTGIILR